MVNSSLKSFSAGRNCCFCLPIRWQKVPSLENDEQQSNATLWSRGVAALKKIREWSEIVAGPKWKTFIRRFNQDKSFARQTSKYQYDPLSYELNFDQGPLQNGDPETENEYLVRNFSSRYVKPVAMVQVNGVTSVDQRKDAVDSSFV